jgi:hypothetical protein
MPGHATGELTRRDRHAIADLLSDHRGLPAIQALSAIPGFSGVTELLLFPMRSCPARADVTLPPRAPIATGHIWRALRVGVRIAVEIHMMSAQCSGFLGADPDAQGSARRRHVSARPGGEHPASQSTAAPWARSSLR